MKLALRVLIVCAVLTPLAAQQPRVQTATRFVVNFTNLENQLMDALVANQREAAGRLLADDFAQWTPTPPGDPTPREDWLKPDRSDMSDFRIRQVAVKDLGDHAIVSFVMTAIKGKAWFVIDIWQKSGPEWKLATRYLSAIDPAPFRGDAKPTGRN